MNLKFVDINNTAERTAYLKLIDDDYDEQHIVQLTPHQVFFIMRKAATILWADYKLVPRD